MQHEITKKCALLNDVGDIAEPGYAKQMYYVYNRDKIAVGAAKLKEWDYYYIGNSDFALCLTIADNGYLGALSATVLNFTKPWQITQSAAKPFTLGKLKMPLTSEVGDVSATAGKVKMTFTNDGTTRRLFGAYPKFRGDETLEFDVTLSEAPRESMVIATPFDKPKHFYFNQKINCMKARGAFSIGDTHYAFTDENKSLATLDWGRGVWTYDNTWYWGSMQTTLESGKRFGFNIGYGFGNTSAASENMLFYDGQSHKLDAVDFGIPGDAEGKPDYMKPWHFTSNDNRLEMTFEPIIDRYAPIDVGFFAMIPHQVFGKMSGYGVLDDGTKIEFTNALGFAEKVHNKW